MRSFIFWQRWLFVSGFLVVMFGLLMALFNDSQLMHMIDERVDPVFWGKVMDEGSTANFKKWVYGTWGSTIAGWGVVILYISAIPFKRKERWAHRSISAGLIVWYTLDTGISYYHGVYFNIALNTLFLLIVGLPLLATIKEFRR